MAYFEHRFDTVIRLHPVGTYSYTVVYLDPKLVPLLPFHEAARLRIEADVSGVPVKGAWQPAGGRWYLMLPKGPLRQAGLKVGAEVEVSFRLLSQDQVDIPPELAGLLKADPALRKAWNAISAGKQRGLAHMIASAKKAETRAARLQQVRGIVLGELPEPWKRAAGRKARGS
jgi:hypothetical protein